MNSKSGSHRIQRAANGRPVTWPIPRPINTVRFLSIKSNETIKWMKDFSFHLRGGAAPSPFAVHGIRGHRRHQLHARPLQQWVEEIMSLKINSINFFNICRWMRVQCRFLRMEQPRQRRRFWLVAESRISVDPHGTDPWPALIRQRIQLR